MFIKSSHGDYLSNHRYFIVCIPNSRYSIYVSDRLLLYFTIYQDKLENKKIPEDIDYHKVYILGKEAEQKLSEIRPASVGQASRISGVSPADVSVLLVYLQQKGNKKESK